MRDDPGWWWETRWAARRIRWRYIPAAAVIVAFIAWTALDFPGWR